MLSNLRVSDSSTIMMSSLFFPENALSLEHFQVGRSPKFVAYCRAQARTTELSGHAHKNTRSWLMIAVKMFSRVHQRVCGARIEDELGESGACSSLFGSVSSTRFCNLLYLQLLREKSVLVTLSYIWYLLYRVFFFWISKEEVFLSRIFSSLFHFFYIHMYVESKEVLKQKGQKWADRWKKNK